MRERIGVLGGGLVGALISVLLVKKGFRVEVFEKRPDPRKSKDSEGRSINLALPLVISCSRQGYRITSILSLGPMGPFPN